MGHRSHERPKSKSPPITEEQKSRDAIFSITRKTHDITVQNRHSAAGAYGIAPKRNYARAIPVTESRLSISMDLYKLSRQHKIY